MLFARTVLLLSAALFGGFGAWLLWSPEQLERWVGIGLADPLARTEVRAFYGGLELGLAACLLLAARHRRFVGPACLCLGIAMSGIALGRVTGLVLEGSGAASMLWFLATEVLLAGLGFLGYRLAR